MSYERKLVSAIKRKDELKIEKLFEEIYYKYGKLVGFIISKYVSNVNDVEELINDVFLKFSRVLYTIKFDNIKYYLIVQAKNAAINFVKKTKKINFEYIDDYFEDSIDMNTESIIYEVICNMKKCLTEYEINIILLHSIYCYSFVELAKKYNKPTTTISSTYHRAIKKINNFYIREGIFK